MSTIATIVIIGLVVLLVPVLFFVLLCVIAATIEELEDRRP